MAWQTPFTTWVNNMVPGGTDINRIEGNDAALAAGIGLPVGGVDGTTITGMTNVGRFVGTLNSAGPPPSGGPFLLNDFYIDTNQVIWICYTAGSPGSWSPLTARTAFTGFGLTSTSVTESWRAIPTAAGTFTGVQGIGGRIRMPFAGSVVGIAVNCAVSIASGTLTVVAWKNGVSLGAPAVVLSGVQTATQTASYGSATFAAGDRLSCAVSSGSTTSTQVEATLFVQFAQ